LRPVQLSIVTVVKNQLADLRLTIRSIRNQTVRHAIEHVIVDGASCDGTIEFLERFDDRNFRWISEPDRGVYDAMNKGIRIAKGKWVLFLNAGDILIAPSIGEHILPYLDSDIKTIYFAIKFGAHPTSCVTRHVSYSKERRSIDFYHQGTLIQRSFLLSHGGYKTYFKVISDCIFNEMYSLPASHLIVNTPVTFMNNRGMSSRPNFRTWVEYLYLDIIIRPLSFSLKTRLVASFSYQAIKSLSIFRKRRSPN